MSDFTPGPWNFHPSDEYVNSFDVMCEEGYYVATTHDGVREDKNADANARLIAAAPDLLEALQDVDALWTHHSIAHSDGKISPLHEKVIAAIAKATGDQL